MSDFKKYLIDYKTLTKKAVSKINSLGGNSLIVVKKKNILEGVLSSRDLRRAILNEKIFNKTIKNIYNNKPQYIYKDKIYEKTHNSFLKIKKINIIPVIEKKSKKIVNILTKKNFDILTVKKSQKLNASVVIMAGGQGMRLRPFTSILPKPLLPIQDKPVIEHIVDQFNKYKPKKFIVTLNYKKEIIKFFFNKLKKQSKINKIDLIYESKPLGTAGSLFKIKKNVTDIFFLTNCDTILKYNYNSILSYHKKNKNDITIVVTKKKFKLPYGVINIKKSEFLFNEKPLISNLVNTGFYIISKKCLNILKKETFLDFNVFLEIAKKNKKKISFYEINPNCWIDVGQLNNFKSEINTEI